MSFTPLFTVLCFALLSAESSQSPPDHERVPVMKDGFLPNPTTDAAPSWSKFESLSMRCQAICEPIERWTLNHPLRASIAWMGFLFAAMLSIHTAAYETNDDVAMSMMASGTGLAAQPDEHLVFTNVVIGLLLKHLYTQMPAIPWYGMYLLGVHFLSHVAILYAVLKWRYSRAALFCYWVLFSTIGVLLLTKLQFTSTAIWSVECGLFLTLSGLALRRDVHGRGGWGMLVSGILLMMLGSLVRFDSYIAAMAISAIPLSILVWQLDRFRAPESRVWRTALATIVFTQIAAFGLQAAHQNYYSRDPAWRAFLDFNPYRVQFNDYAVTRYTAETKPVFDRVGWSENDHEMIRLWFFDDPQIFGRKNLQAILEGFPWAKEAVSLGKMSDWWRDIINNKRIWPLWALIPLQLWLARDRQFAFRHFLLLTASLDLVICGLMFLKQPPERVYVSLIAFQALYMLYLMREGDSTPEVHAIQIMPPGGPVPAWRGVVLRGSIALRGTVSLRGSLSLRGTLSPWTASAALVAVAILGLLFGQSTAYRDSRRAVSANRQLHADLDRIGPLESDLFVCWGASFPLESILPLESPHRLRQLHLLGLGWSQHSPANDAVKAHFGIRDLTRALVDNPHVYLLGSTPGRGGGVLMDHYGIYIREHYGIDVEWDYCYEGSEFNVYKPVREAPGGNLIRNLSQFIAELRDRVAAIPSASNRPTNTTSSRWQKTQRGTR